MLNMTNSAIVHLPTGNLDPYLFMAQQSDFLDYAMHPVTGSLRVAFSAEIVSGALGALQKSLGGNGFVCVDPGQWTAARFCTGWVNAAGLVTLSTLTKIVVRFEMASPIRAQRSQDRARRQITSAQLGVTQKVLAPKATVKSKVLFGLIDSGCPFAHSALLDPSGQTRIRALWDQDISPDFHGLGSLPIGFKYGREVRASELNQLVSGASVGGGVNEDLCYRRAGYSAVRGARSHGAHSLGLLATSRGSAQHVKNRAQHGIAEIAFVQLPRSVLAAPSHAAMSRAIIDGLRWIVDQADAKERIVVAIPYAGSLGPHDGSSIFEQAVDEIIQTTNAVYGGKKPRLEVVVGAGNSYELDCHATLSDPKEPITESLTWRVPPSSEIPAFVEIWVPNGVDLSVAVTAPDGSSTNEISRGSALAWPDASDPICQVIHSFWQGIDASLLLVRLAPTQTSDGSRSASFGDWTIHLNVKTGASSATVIHAYASRGRGSFGAPLRGRQSKFVENPSRSKWTVESTGTISAMACGTETTVVGGYENWRGQNPARYTAAGPSRSGARQDVDYSRPSEEFPSLSGIRSIGTRSGSTFRMDGGSVAVPQVAQILADRSLTPRNPGIDNRLGTRL